MKYLKMIYDFSKVSRTNYMLTMFILCSIVTLIVAWNTVTLGSYTFGISLAMLYCWFIGWPILKDDKS